MTRLLRTRGFLPFIAVVFLNSFVDLGHKIIIQNALFKAYDGAEQVWLTSIVNALILLPFILLFTPAGFVADRWSKNRVMRVGAALAVVITLGITACYYLGLFWPAFAMTFVLATQSAIYSPAKFGYIKELSGNEALTIANAWVQAAVSTSILSGILVFSMLFEARLLTADGAIGGVGLDPDTLLRRVAPVGWFLVLGSLLELALTFRLPDRWPEDRSLRFDWPAYLRGGYLRQNLHAAWHNQVIWLSIIGIGVFWGIAQVLMAVFPTFVEERLGETNTVSIQGTMACAGIGVVLGAMLAGRAARDHVELGLIPVGAIGIALVLFLLPGIDQLWLHGVNFFAMGLLAGLFLVPLNALIQFHAGERALGRVLAAKNFITNWIMLLALGLTLLAAIAHSGSGAIMFALALVAAGGAGYTIWQLPQSLVRFAVAQLVATHYRLRVIGLDHLPAQGGVLLLGNHISWIDWAMVQMACPRPVRFVMERSIYERRIWRWLLDLFGVVPISRGRARHALHAVTELLDRGEVVCLFPEGTLSKNGQLAAFKQGFEVAARGARGEIVPFYLRGLWGSRFSFASDRLKRTRRDGRIRDVIVAFGAPLPMDSSARQVKQAVVELSVSSWQQHAEGLPTLPRAWLAMARRHPGREVLIDVDGKPLSNRRLMASVLLTTRALRRRCPGPRVGILLPPGRAAVIANLAVWCAGKAVVNLRPPPARAPVAGRPGADAQPGSELGSDPGCKQGQWHFQHALQATGVGQVIGAYPSAAAEADADADSGTGATTEWLALDDLLPARNRLLGLAAWTAALLAATLLPASLLMALYGRRVRPHQTAAILFPVRGVRAARAVAINHRNLLANCRQIADVLNLECDDLLLAGLPLDHAYGLTLTLALPLLEGIPLVCHPDPTDALGQAHTIARHQVSLLCATPSQLQGLVAHPRVHPVMLAGLRLVVAAGGPLGRALHDGFALRFNQTLYAGYGATEATPLASLNVPDAIETNTWKLQIGNRPGTVGMPLPGTCYRIVDPLSLATLPADTEGEILIGGVQVMQGYLHDPAATTAAIVELDRQRWYRTGDRGRQDAEGFLTITGQGEVANPPA